MNDLYVERRALHGARLAPILARHLYARCGEGRSVILTEYPSRLKGSVAKAWHRLEHEVRRQRSSTLDLDRIRILDQELAMVRSLRFSTMAVPDDTWSAVIFMKPDHAELPPACHTLYVTCKMPMERLSLLTVWMPMEGAVVIFDD